jgi:hypothetical protein
MNDRTLAHGRAAHAVVRWLHGKAVGTMSLRCPLDDSADPTPKSPDEIEGAIRRTLANPVGEMFHVGGKPVDHLPASHPAVQESSRLARMLPGDDPVEHMERCLEDLGATLHSPRVRRAVTELASGLLKAPHCELSGEAMARMIDRSLRKKLRPEDNCVAHPRTIRIYPQRRAAGAEKRDIDHDR